MKTRLILSLALFTGIALGCELLVKLDYTPHEDPAIDAAGKYKPGDCVVIREEGAARGALERLPLFWRISIPEVGPQTFTEYLVPQVEDGTNVVRRRQWQITTNTLPAEWHAKLMASGTLVLRASGVVDGYDFDADWNDFKTNILNHATGQTETRRIVGFFRQARLAN